MLSNPDVLRDRKGFRTASALVLHSEHSLRLGKADPLCVPQLVRGGNLALARRAMALATPLPEGIKPIAIAWHRHTLRIAADVAIRLCRPSSASPYSQLFRYCLVLRRSLVSSRRIAFQVLSEQVTRLGRACNCCAFSKCERCRFTHGSDVAFYTVNDGLWPRN